MKSQESICTACRLAISSEDSVSVHNGQLLHVDCNRPRALRAEERLLLATYCWDHSVADCAACERAYRVPELISVLVKGRTHYCPFCHHDLIESVRAHLYECTMLPPLVRRRARETRATARRLAKRSHELMNAAEILMREAEVAVKSLRDAMRESRKRQT